MTSRANLANATYGMVGRTSATSLAIEFLTWATFQENEENVLFHHTSTMFLSWTGLLFPPVRSMLLLARLRQEVRELNKFQRSCCPLCSPFSPVPCFLTPKGSVHRFPSPFELRPKTFLPINSDKWICCYSNPSLYRRLKQKRKWDVRLAVLSI